MKNRRSPSTTRHPILLTITTSRRREGDEFDDGPSFESPENHPVVAVPIRERLRLRPESPERSPPLEDPRVLVVARRRPLGKHGLNRFELGRAVKSSISGCEQYRGGAVSPLDPHHAPLQPREPIRGQARGDDGSGLRLRNRRVGEILSRPLHSNPLRLPKHGEPANASEPTREADPRENLESCESRDSSDQIAHVSPSVWSPRRRTPGLTGAPGRGT